MYKPGTILELKDQKPASERTNREGEPITDEKGKPIKFEFPYNKVKVIGESPIDHSLMAAGWEGAGARGVIITPLSEFGGNLDEPFGKLQQLYNVVEIPADEMPIQPQVRIIRGNTGEAGKTPEEVFASEAPGKPQDGRKRARSPLGEVEGAPSASPLGRGEPKVAEKPTRKSPLS